MRVLEVFVVATFVACALPAAAQSGVQTQRLMATTIPLDAPPTSSPIAAIWQDRLAAERKKLAALSVDSAKFVPAAVGYFCQCVRRLIQGRRQNHHSFGALHHAGMHQSVRSGRSEPQ